MQTVKGRFGGKCGRDCVHLPLGGGGGDPGDLPGEILKMNDARHANLRLYEALVLPPTQTYFKCFLGYLTSKVVPCVFFAHRGI